MPYQFEVQAATIAAVSEVMAKKDVRYYLNGVHFLRIDNQLRVAGTNGHIGLIALQNSVFETEDSIDLILEFTRDQLSAIRKKANLSKQVLFIVENDEVRMCLAGMTSIVEVVDGKFPDIERVIPAENRTIELTVPALQPHLLMPLLKAAECMPSIAEMHKARSVEFHQINEHDSVLVLFPHAPKIRGVIMPMRK